jgi:hypothetical protein
VEWRWQLQAIFLQTWSSPLSFDYNCCAFVYKVYLGQKYFLYIYVEPTGNVMVGGLFFIAKREGDIINGILIHE